MLIFLWGISVFKILWRICVFIFLWSLSVFIFLWSISVLYSKGVGVCFCSYALSVCYILMEQQCVSRLMEHLFGTNSLFMC